MTPQPPDNVFVFDRHDPLSKRPSNESEPGSPAIITPVSIEQLETICEDGTELTTPTRSVRMFVPDRMVLEKTKSNELAQQTAFEDKLDKDRETYARVEKPSNTYLRWNLLFAFLILISLTMPIWICFIPVIRHYAIDVVVGLIASTHLIWAFATVNVFYKVMRLRMVANKHKVKPVENGIPATDSKCHHLCNIVMYKEPMALMYSTLDSLARQRGAKEKIYMSVGLEERTPEASAKIEELTKKYQHRFKILIMTVHPYKTPGEIAGKCSNTNYSCREAVSILKTDKTINTDNYDTWIMTTGDCDTVFGDRFIDTLEKEWRNTKSLNDQRNTVWQSPLFYQMGIEKSPFFVRVTGLLRAYFMMGLLIPLNINTMSVFSLTLWLAEQGEFTHPAYQMEDIIALIRWTLKIGKVCRIKVLYTATMSGPTSGKNYVDELREWARQIQRWTIGAAEVFHYFVVKSTRIPFLSAITWGTRFIMYYGIILCVAPIFSLLAPLTIFIILELTGLGYEADYQPWGLLGWTSMNISLGALFALQYFWFACVFIANKLAEPTFPDGIVDKTPLWRSFFHWIGALPTIVGYCCIELYGFLIISYQGKSACTHEASKKDDLKITRRESRVAQMIGSVRRSIEHGGHAAAAAGRRLSRRISSQHDQPPLTPTVKTVA